jgi:hypothetical protein
VNVPRVFLRVPDEAAKACGVSPDHFNKHIRPELAGSLIRRGRLVLVPVTALERWGERQAA